MNLVRGSSQAELRRTIGETDLSDAIARSCIAIAVATPAVAVAL